MKIRVMIASFVIISLVVFVAYYTVSSEQRQPFQFSKDPQIQQIKPKKPVKIRLHRNAKGEYSWDLTGDSVDEVVKTDTRLRKLLKVE